MKKWIALLLILCLCGTFYACSSAKDDTAGALVSPSDVTCPKCGTGFRGNTTYAKMIEKYGYCGFGLCDKD